MLITTTGVISVFLLAALFFLAFKVLESNWSYQISKPYAWEEAVKQKTVSRELRKIERSYRDKVRFYNLWFQTERLKRNGIAGAFAEVGVYKGETARMIHAMDPGRTFHLFDTFTGFVKADLEHEKIHTDNQLVDFSDTSVEGVKHFVQGNDNVIFHPGYFPATATGIDAGFALVHVDADLYSPTLAALNFFYPKLVKGGVIIIHDYNHNWSGVRKALDEFMAGIAGQLVEVTDWQGSVMIFKST